ncbi:leucine aminopeptidase 1-like protein [Tanacetum coccineum]|uniref:Leucine aminopeptidase 1-like protein n=1 Tax=Tanacetum coccineum TaxID=301880 RepID=A0ABQ5CTL4_9ASTR
MSWELVISIKKMKKKAVMFHILSWKAQWLLLMTSQRKSAKTRRFWACLQDITVKRLSSLSEQGLEEFKTGSYLGVSVASTNPPKFIHLYYKPQSESVKTKLAIVGKGLNFDSGGYNIKTGPGYSTEMMNCDMGRSSAVLGAVNALGQITPLRVEVHFIVAACENMISGTGVRPRDILTASNGKKIEVNNIDAEGKLNV